MTIIDINSRSIHQLADHYARSRKHRERPVSIAAAIRAIRILSPDMRYTDKELASIVAAAALDHGHSVDFDSV